MNVGGTVITLILLLVRELLSIEFVNTGVSVSGLAHVRIVKHVGGLVTKNHR